MQDTVYLKEKLRQILLLNIERTFCGFHHNVISALSYSNNFVTSGLDFFAILSKNVRYTELRDVCISTFCEPLLASIVNPTL